MNDHRHDRHARLHRQVKGAFFERRQIRRDAACALRRQDDGLALVAHGIDQGLHRLDSGDGILAIDHHHAAEFEDLAEHRQALDFPLAHAGHVAAQQFGADHHIGFALVVEDEDRRARFPQVLFAAHFKVQIDQGAGGVREQGNREIGRLAPRTRERVDRQARRKGRHQADGGGHGANKLSRRGPATAGEARDGPVSVAGQGAQLLARVERHGVADAL